MVRDYVVRGVPNRLSADGWWLSGTPEEGEAGRKVPLWSGLLDGAVLPPLGLVLVALVALADFLFFGHRLGLSLAVFALALGGAVWLAMGRVGFRAVMLPGVVLGFSVLPVVDEVQALSLLILVAGLCLFMVLLVMGRDGGAERLVGALVRFVAVLPVQGLRDLAPELGAAARGLRLPERGALGAVARGWALPGVVGLGFLALLLAANPFLERWLASLADHLGELPDMKRRLLFWAFIGLVLWPFLAVAKRHGLITKPIDFRDPAGRVARGAAEAGWMFVASVNASSVANSLVVFNLLFLVQTGLDLTYLWGGAALPEGMSHAEYAHRGAYPLVATALLAGGFALISRPFAEGRLLRGLLMLWIGQNVLLTLSALYRLDLYVGSFGLTYLRLHAGIWMALVAAGLALTFWQVLARRDNLWLVKWNAVLLAGVLYGASLVNFAGVIAAENLAPDRTAQVEKVDMAYICGLGPNAKAAIWDYGYRSGHWPCRALRDPVIAGWRDWGFRKWRVRRYLLSHVVAVGARL